MQIYEPSQKGNRMKYLILGAGPAGLTLANKLLQNKENDLLVLERNSEAGGLCRSQDVDGSPLDIGGGHFLDVRNPKVLDFLFPFMPEDEWDRYEHALEDLKAAELLLEKEQYKSAVNRSYYSIFHAIRAVLAYDDIDSKKHII